MGTAMDFFSLFILLVMIVSTLQLLMQAGWNVPDATFLIGKSLGK